MTMKVDVGSLKSRLAIEREHAIESLARQGDRHAHLLILAAVGDRNAGVRARAAEALANFPGARSCKALVPLLSDRDNLVRINAAEALGELRATSAISKLVESLRNDRDELVRAYAAEALGRMRRPMLKAVLAECLRRERANAVRLRIIAGLYALGERGRWSEVMPFLDDEDYRVRSAAASFLEEFASPTRRGTIRKALSDRLKVEPALAVSTRLEDILRRMQVRKRAIRSR